MQITPYMARLMDPRPTMPYQWRITKDRISRADERTRVGVTGPHNPDPALDTLDATAFAQHATAVKFRMSDDDRNVYYEGVIAGTFDGFEPLDDFGAADAGCVRIEFFENRKWVLL